MEYATTVNLTIVEVHGVVDYCYKVKGTKLLYIPQLWHKAFIYVS